MVNESYTTTSVFSHNYSEYKGTREFLPLRAQGKLMAGTYLRG
jgi:hypothetical protein